MDMDMRVSVNMDVGMDVDVDVDVTLHRDMGASVLTSGAISSGSSSTSTSRSSCRSTTRTKRRSSRGKSDGSADSDGSVDSDGSDGSDDSDCSDCSDGNYSSNSRNSTNRSRRSNSINNNNKNNNSSNNNSTSTSTRTSRASARSARKAQGSSVGSATSPTHVAVGPFAPEAASAATRARVTLGVAAMARKAHSLPMQSILSAVRAAAPHIDTVVLDEAALLHAPAAAWWRPRPAVDALLAFHSRGFPLEKVADAVDGRCGASAGAGATRSPFLVNDLQMQAVMLNRVRIRDVLRRAGVPQPRSVVVDRGRGDDAVVQGDTLVVRDARGEVVARMAKPFVEKPVIADDHDVYVYYVGGGVRRLFRKRSGRSSELRRGDSGAVRRSGSYLYQEFHAPRGCVDVKVYAVGGELFYAEQRKAPTVDGRVERTADGFEVRQRVGLTEEEQLLATRVWDAFRQFVLGFDVLRTSTGDSLVIDVNGWSFVKGNKAFADVVGRMLARCLEKNVVEEAVAPGRLVPQTSQEGGLRQAVGCHTHAVSGECDRKSCKRQQ